jgi:hypothetical protein
MSDKSLPPHFGLILGWRRACVRPETIQKQNSTIRKNKRKKSMA